MEENRFICANIRVVISIFILLFNYVIKQEEKELTEKINLINYEAFYKNSRITNSIEQLIYLESENKSDFEKNKMLFMKRIDNNLSDNLKIFVQDIFYMDNSGDVKEYFSLRNLQELNESNIKFLNKSYSEFVYLNSMLEMSRTEKSALKKTYLEKNGDNVSAYIMFPFYLGNKLVKIYGVNLNLKRTLENMVETQYSLYKEAYFTTEDGAIIGNIYTSFISDILNKKNRYFLEDDGFKISRFYDNNYQIAYRINYYILLLSSLIIAFIISNFITYFAIKIFDYIAENKLLHRKSVFDSLTGILNRRGFYEVFDKNSNISAIALLDIDNFKQINDTYGHSAGDLVLIEVANVVKRNWCDCDCNQDSKDIITCRLNEKFCVRWGGEEILIGMNISDRSKFLEILEKLRLDIENIAFENHPELKATVSIGATTGHIDSMKKFNDAFEIIDANLYQAKKSGKNKIIFSKE